MKSHLLRSLFFVVVVAVPAQKVDYSGIRFNVVDQVELELEDEIIQILQTKWELTKTAIESTRKFLSRIRKWVFEHPAEAGLGRCLTGYSGLPDRRRTAKPGNRSSNKEKLPNNITKALKSQFRSLDEKKRVQKVKKTAFHDLKEKIVDKLVSLYNLLSDGLERRKWIGCSLKYLLNKLLEWIDKAPE